MTKEILSFYTRTHKHIFLACMTLHNFICDNNLHDREFDRCDADEEYLLQHSATADTQEDDNQDEENEDTMNTIRSRTADALVSARGRSLC